MTVKEVSVCCKSGMKERLVKVGDYFQWVMVCDKCGEYVSFGLKEKRDD